MGSGFGDKIKEDILPFEGNHNMAALEGISKDAKIGSIISEVM